MSGTLSFHTLIEGLAGAVVEAQAGIEMHEISHLRDYFDEDNRPRSVTIRLPSLHPQAEEGDEDLYRAPLLPLVSTNNLRIREVDISFNADLADLGAQDPVPPASSATGAWESPRPGGRAGPRGSRGAPARCRWRAPRRRGMRSPVDRARAGCRR